MTARTGLIALFVTGLYAGCVSTEKDMSESNLKMNMDISLPDEIKTIHTPGEAARQLEEGHARYMHHEAKMQKLPQQTRNAVRPFALVVAADAKDALPEVLFDQPKGSLITLHWNTQSNVAPDVTTKMHDGTKLIMVLTRHQCSPQCQTVTLSPNQGLEKELYKRCYQLQASNKAVAAAVKEGRCQLLGAIHHASTNRVQFVPMPFQ